MSTTLSTSTTTTASLTIATIWRRCRGHSWWYSRYRCTIGSKSSRELNLLSRIASGPKFSIGTATIKLSTTIEVWMILVMTILKCMAMWPKPLTEMTVVMLSYQLKLTNHTILYEWLNVRSKSDHTACQINFKVNVVSLLPGMRHFWRHLGVWLSSGENVRTYWISIVRTVSQHTTNFKNVL